VPGAPSGAPGPVVPAGGLVTVLSRSCGRSRQIAPDRVRTRASRRSRWCRPARPAPVALGPAGDEAARTGEPSGAVGVPDGAEQRRPGPPAPGDPTGGARGQLRAGPHPGAAVVVGAGQPAPPARRSRCPAGAVDQHRATPGAFAAATVIAAAAAPATGEAAGVEEVADADALAGRPAEEPPQAASAAVPATAAPMPSSRGAGRRRVERDRVRVRTFPSPWPGRAGHARCDPEVPGPAAATRAATGDTRPVARAPVCPCLC
jgi:hypothetical protein